MHIKEAAMKQVPDGKRSDKKIGGAIAPQTSSLYQSWQRPFYGKSKDESMKAGISVAKGFGVFFAMKF